MIPEDTWYAVLAKFRNMDDEIMWGTPSKFKDTVVEDFYQDQTFFNIEYARIVSFKLQYEGPLVIIGE